jgi:hypothetical protein
MAVGGRFCQTKEVPLKCFVKEYLEKLKGSERIIE